MPKQPNPKPVKPRKAFALVDSQDYIDPDTVERKARWAKESGRYGMTFEEHWKMLQSQGYRCVRVVIQEDTND